VGDPEMPFRVRVKTFYPNSSLASNPSGYEPVKSTAGLAPASGGAKNRAKRK